MAFSIFSDSFPALGLGLDALESKRCLLNSDFWNDGIAIDKTKVRLLHGTYP